MPEAAKDDTRPAGMTKAKPKRPGTAPRYRLPVGRAPFRLFPADLLDAEGTVCVSDLCEHLKDVSIVVGLALQGDDALSLSTIDRAALASVTRCISDAFESLADLTDEAEAEDPRVIEHLEQRCRQLEDKLEGRDRLIEVMKEELGAGFAAPRRCIDRTELPIAPAPDLTEPADPPLEARG